MDHQVHPCKETAIWRTVGLVVRWWKQRIDVNPDSSEGQRHFKELVTQADLLIETETPGRLTQLHLDFPLADIEPTTRPGFITCLVLPTLARSGRSAIWSLPRLVGPFYHCAGGC